jgi:hypothetical protein
MVSEVFLKKKSFCSLSTQFEDSFSKITFLGPIIKFVVKLSENSRLLRNFNPVENIGFQTIF